MFYKLSETGKKTETILQMFRCTYVAIHDTCYVAIRLYYPISLHNFARKKKKTRMGLAAPQTQRRQLEETQDCCKYSLNLLLCHIPLN